MKNKKLICIFLAAILLFTTCFVYAAGEDVVFSIDSVEVPASDATVSVPIRITHNSGHAAGDITITSDLEIVSIDGSNSIFSIISNAARGKVNWSFDSNKTATGEIATVVLKLPEGAEEGDTWGVNVEIVDLVDAEYQSVTYSVAAGTVSATAPISHTHTYNSGVVTTAPTCTAEGVKTFTCSGCGESYTEAVAATGHKYDKGVVTPPTSTQQGYTTYTCTNPGCGESYKDNYTDILDDSAAKFTIDKQTVRLGDTFVVALNIKNNPGITTAQVLVGYDADVLELVSTTEKDFSGTSFGPLTANPIAVSWSDTLRPNNTNNGVLAELTFKVKDNAAEGDTEITLSYDPDNVFNSDWDNVNFQTVNGIISVIDYITGDVNSDGKVNFKDSGILLQFLNGWDVTIEERAADVNGDGKVNMKDYGLFIQYLNGWPVTFA